MPQPASITTAPNDLIAVFRASQRRIELEQATILTDPNKTARRRRLASLKRTVDAELRQLEQAAGTWLTDQLPDIYKGGQIGAGLGRPIFEAVDRQAVALLAENTGTQILSATAHMSDDTKRWIRETSTRLQGEGLIEGYTPKQLAKRMADLAPKAATVQGMPSPITAVRYKNGATVPIDRYAEMLFRTETAVAYNTGTLNEGAKFGVTRYEGLDGTDCGLTSHDDPQKVNGFVFTTELARQNPIGHPQCTRSWIPRPDLDPDGLERDQGVIGRDVGAFDPTPTPEQRRAQQAADDARDTTTARRTARTARTRRAARSQAKQEARTAAIEAAEEAARAKQAAEAVAAKRRAYQGRRKAARTRTENRHGDVLRARGITADQFNMARRQLDEIKAQLRVDAADLAGRLADADPVRTLSPIPRVVRSTDPNTGRTVSRRGAGGEWDFLNDLTPAERRWIGGRQSKGGIGPDDVAQQYGLPKSQNDEAVARWLDDAQRTDAAKSVAAGKDPAYYDVDDIFRGESPLAQELTDRNIAISDLLQDDVAEAVGVLAEADQDMIVRYADEILVARTSRPRPWDMTAGEYADELSVYAHDPKIAEFMERVSGGYVPVSDGERFVVARFDELVPDGLGLDAEDLAGSWEQIRHLATQAGILSP